MLLSKKHTLSLLIQRECTDSVLPSSEEATLVTKHIKEHFVDLRTGIELKEQRVTAMEM